MPFPHVQFTIRSLMVTVAIVGGLLALCGRFGAIILPLGLLSFAVVGTQWVVFREKRRLAAFVFWTLAVLINLLYIASCVAPDIYLLGLLFFAWLVFLAPVIGGAGAAWARLATRVGGLPQRSVLTAWVSVIGLTLMPLVTLWTFWPLHLAFFTFRPALDRLADRVAAGASPTFPRWVGPFRVAQAAIDPDSGNVGLMIDANPSGPTGLVRVRPGVPTHPSGPFRGDDLTVDLGRGWEYREED
jgi:hypothetical protein